MASIGAAGVTLRLVVVRPDQTEGSYTVVGISNEAESVVGQSYPFITEPVPTVLAISASLGPNSQPTELVAEKLARATSYRLRATLTSSRDLHSERKGPGDGRSK